MYYKVYNWYDVRLIWIIISSFQAAEFINQHYLRLDACVINRGKLLHSALSSLQNLDRSLDKFLGWLSEAESVVETLEGDTESRRATQQLKELQADVERQAQTHRSLRNSSLALLGSLAAEDALMLQLRGDEMERRWQVKRHSKPLITSIQIKMFCYHVNL